MRMRVPTHRPLFTQIFLGINVLVWLVMTVAGGSQDPYVLVRFGAKYNPLIVSGQYWRLLTACFIHIGIVHLLFNSYALYSFGMQLERRYGRLRFLAIYLSSGIFSTAVSFVGNEALAAGASGAIFGLMGATIAYFVTYRKQFGLGGRSYLSQLLTIAAFNLLWGFSTPGIDNLAHIGGLFAGLFLGWAYCPKYRATLGDKPQGFGLVSELHFGRILLGSVVTLLMVYGLTSLGILIHRTTG